MKDATTTAEVRPHGLTLENRARAVLTGVSDVDLFSAPLGSGYDFLRKSF